MGEPHLQPLLAIVIGYLAGSIPSAYLAGRWSGVDLRKHGSGNLGATNALRVLGPRIGGAVFAVDVLKGFLPVFFLPAHTATPDPEMLAIAIGVAAIIGHVRPVFLLWRGGGKGVATATGVFLGLAWIPAVVSFCVWVVVLRVWRYVSLASLAGAVALPLSMLVMGLAPDDPVFIVAVLVVLFVFYTHRANISRLRRGEELRFERSRATADHEPAGDEPADPRPPRAA